MDKPPASVSRHISGPSRAAPSHGVSPSAKPSTPSAPDHVPSGRQVLPTSRAINSADLEAIKLPRTITTTALRPGAVESSGGDRRPRRAGVIARMAARWPTRPTQQRGLGRQPRAVPGMTARAAHPPATAGGAGSCHAARIAVLGTSARPCALARRRARRAGFEATAVTAAVASRVAGGGLTACTATRHCSPGILERQRRHNIFDYEPYPDPHTGLSSGAPRSPPPSAPKWPEPAPTTKLRYATSRAVQRPNASPT